MPPRRSEARETGVVAPLFSFPSTRSWGVGDIGDIEALGEWLQDAGIGILQLLPINEMAPGERSPYSAISAMAMDPVFICVSAVEDFIALGGEDAFDASFREQLREVRAAARIDYERVRALKAQALRASFRRFLDCDWRRGTPRGTALGRFIEEQAWWLEDYRLFRALHARQGEAAWTTWDEPLRTRQPEALRRARTELADEILYHAYLQWTADTQWLRARDRAGVELFGDLPFMVDLDSADVWAHQESFNLDESVGVPPDAFSATGQDWGLPAYRWEVLRERDFDWLRQRARRGAALYDGYRIDHVVGFYRTYVRTRDGARAYFNPPDQDRQLESGEMLMAVFREAGAQVIAEDLGTVPDFVRVSLTRLGIPGYRVLRWEREWKQPGQPFHDPSQYPPLSAATSGTHDTDTMAVWWEQAQPEERASLAGIPKLRDRLRGIDFNTAPYTPSVRDALLETLFASGSNLLLLPIQDIFGWRDRINEPATVSEQNWTYRLPWPSDRIRAQVEAAERAATLRKWGRQYDRLPGNSTRT